MTKQLKNCNYYVEICYLQISCGAWRLNTEQTFRQLISFFTLRSKVTRLILNSLKILVALAIPIPDYPFLISHLISSDIVSENHSVKYNTNLVLT